MHGTYDMGDAAKKPHGRAQHHAHEHAPDTARGHVSPIGGVSNRSPGDRSPGQETSEQPKMPGRRRIMPGY